MSALRRFRLELSRLLQNRAVWLAAALTVCAPAAGLRLYRPLYAAGGSGYVTTLHGMYLANPALAGGLLGAIVFGLLTVWTLGRDRRSGMETLTAAAVSPQAMALLRTGALACVSLLTYAAVLLVWLPFGARRLGAFFDPGSALCIYVLFGYAPLLLAVLLASAAYQFTQRCELALLLFAAFAALSLTVWKERWLLCWLNPCVWALSDDFSNDRLFRSVAYARLCWLAALAGVWLLSWLCVRRYGKGAVGSLLHNARRRAACLPLAAALLAGAGALVQNQPFLDRSGAEMDFRFLFAEEDMEYVACSERYADVHPDPKTGGLYGTAKFRFQNTSGQPQAVRFLISPGYTVDAVRANGRAAPFAVELEQQLNEKAFTVTLPPDPETELVIEYGGFPQEWNILADWQGSLEISGVYMQLENDVLAPSPFGVGYAGESLPAVMDLTLPGHMTPILFGAGSAGLLRENADGSRVWRMTGEGYRMIVYAGDYVCEPIPVEDAGVTVNFYYSRRHQPVMQAADAAEIIRQTMAFCARRIGPLSSYQNGALDLIERRCSGGGYAGDGASLADELDFTVENLSNGAKGGSSAQVTIHELAHQWWGMGCMFDPMDTESVWSAEGLTCYTTYRIVKELYGAQEAEASFVNVWQEAVDRLRKNFYVRRPEYLSALPERYQAALAARLLDARRYSEMPLKILRAEALVGGEDAMDAILARLFQRETDPAYPYLTYQAFLDACQLTEEDLELA